MLSLQRVSSSRDSGRRPLCRNGVLALLASAALVLLHGCVTTPLTDALDSTIPAGLPAAAHLPSVPFFPQEDYQCGPAALASMLSHNRIVVTPEELVDEVYLPARQGSLTLEMAAAARRRGQLAYPLRPSLSDLFAEVAAGHSVLVLQNLGVDWLPVWHYAVVIGYDLPAERVILHSGRTADLAMSLRDFERTWAGAGHWAQVILPPTRLPASAEYLPLLLAASDLETTRQPQAALDVYRLILARWPDSEAATIGAANSLYRLGNPGEAASLLRAWLAREPLSSVGWNNLAYALLAQGCRPEAVVAATCAVAIAPGDARFAATLQELSEVMEARDEVEEGSGMNCVDSSAACPLR